jgi:hypothetical protein
LFGERRGGEQEANEEPENGPTPRPFADFSNPFASGRAARLDPAELVVYSFRAMEAWAFEQGCSREVEQTPHEFARRLAAKGDAFAREARFLADLYCQAAYSRDPVPPADARQLDRLWQLMER